MPPNVSVKVKLAPPAIPEPTDLQLLDPIFVLLDVNGRGYPSRCRGLRRLGGDGALDALHGLLGDPHVVDAVERDQVCLLLHERLLGGLVRKMTWTSQESKVVVGGSLNW